MSAFSFYPGKNLGACGEAGAIVTNDKEKAEKVRSLRDWGQVGKGNHVYKGFNFRMDGIQGAILGIKLKYLQEWTSSRIKKAQLYYEKLSVLDNIVLPQTRKDSVHVFHIFAVLASQRDKIFEKIKAMGIHCGIHYPVPIHLHPNMNDLGYRKGHFPIAEKIAKNELSLPIHPELSESDVEHVSDSLILCTR